MITQTATRSIINLTLPGGAQPWPQQGEWDYAAYLRLPADGRRYEISLIVNCQRPIVNLATNLPSLTIEH